MARLKDATPASHRDTLARHQCVQEQQQLANGSLRGQELHSREVREMHPRAQGHSRSAAEPELSGAAESPPPSQAAPASAAASGLHRTAPAEVPTSAAGTSPTSTPIASQQHRSEDGAGAEASAGLGALLQDLQKVQVHEILLHTCTVLPSCTIAASSEAADHLLCCLYPWVCTAETIRDMHAHDRHLPRPGLTHSVDPAHPKQLLCSLTRSRTH